MLIIPFYSCDIDEILKGKEYYTEKIAFDLKNNSTEYCHIYFKGDEMSSFNQVGPNSYLTRFIDITFASDKDGNDYDGEVTICVGKNQKKILCETGVVLNGTQKMYAIWDGKDLRIE